MNPSEPKSTAAAPFAVTAISGHLDTRTAATEVAQQLAESLGGSTAGGPCDLLCTFVSFHHRAGFGDAVELIRHAVDARHTLALTAESVLADDEEREGRSGLCSMALRLPGVDLHPWTFEPRAVPDLTDADSVRNRLGVRDDTAGLLMLADPFTTPMNVLLPSLSDRINGPDEQSHPIIGGLCSGASQPGLNMLALDDQTITGGAIGMTFSGNIRMDAVISQGCRPIGPPLVITKVKENAIIEIGGKPPMPVMQEIAAGLDQQDRDLLRSGLLVGFVLDEYKDRFGRGDFLMRNVVAYDTKSQSLMVAERPRVGQTIQFHVRDATTADEDLHLLLDAQQLDDPPFAGLLFTCNGRGERLFGVPDHDASAIRQRLGEVPLAGFFAAGEIGPVSGRAHVHGHTAALALLR